MKYWPTERFDLIARAPNLVTATTDMGALIIDVPHARFIDLNPVATCLWSLLDRPRSLPSLIELAHEQFDIDVETCRRETELWLRDMMERKLVVIEVA